ncbi:hypothetical protein [Brachybacterium sacelli]
MDSRYPRSVLRASTLAGACVCSYFVLCNASRFVVVAVSVRSRPLHEVSI